MILRNSLFLKDFEPYDFYWKNSHENDVLRKMAKMGKNTPLFALFPHQFYHHHYWEGLSPDTLFSVCDNVTVHGQKHRDKIS